MKFELDRTWTTSPFYKVLLASQLQKRKGHALVFVGASLLAMRGGKRASPQANIRWQACLLQGTSQAPPERCGLSL
jgi:hypothetical protein